MARLGELVREIPGPSGLHAVITVDALPAAQLPSCPTLTWHELVASPARTAPRSIDTDVAALSYTSGSTGKPKGVVRSHRNMVASARSVSSYLGNTANDRLLAVPSFSFDYGFSQMSTTCAVGASIVLLDYTLSQGLLQTLDRGRITCLAAVPPMQIQLAEQRWPEGAQCALRYMTNSSEASPQTNEAWGWSAVWGGPG